MQYSFSGVIYNVVDGDTVDAELDLGFKLKIRQRMRLAGIDTPERGQEGYSEATEYLKYLVLNKPLFFITYKQSKFGYYLCDIRCEGNYVNQIMIDKGFAKQYNGGTKDGSGT
jgi:micrococcal nuclease